MAEMLILMMIVLALVVVGWAINRRRQAPS
jgi:hypothetical protein